MEKFKDFGYSWLEEVPGKLWNLLRENPSEENLYAAAGSLLQHLQRQAVAGRRKGFHRPPQGVRSGAELSGTAALLESLHDRQVQFRVPLLLPAASGFGVRAPT